MEKKLFIIPTISVITIEDDDIICTSAIPGEVVQDWEEFWKN